MQRSIERMEGSRTAELRSGLALLIIAVVLILVSGCAVAQTEVGGFAIKDSDSYEVKMSNPLREVQEADGRTVETCDALVMLKGSDYGISASWYDGVAYDEAKAYFEERSESGETVHDERFQLPSQEWRSAGKQDVALPCGVNGYLSKEESVAALGEPYAYYSETLVFPTSDDSIGVLILTAHSEEQKRVEQALFEEVMGNILIG